MEAGLSHGSNLVSKPRYEVLDGLRGVAALLVVWYHVNEGFAFAAGETMVMGLNHGYLAVDFFFMLSGFVIDYAYRDRWNDKNFGVGRFLIRRLIRLHPMLIFGAVLGVISFVIQGSVQWDGTHVAISMIMLALLCAILMVPAVPRVSAYEIRGNGEMFPLNGPSWSLFFEYIGNIIYALIIRRLSNGALIVVTVLLSIGWGAFAIYDVAGYGTIGVGWTLDTVNLSGGLLRMLCPFTIGMLISRYFRPLSCITVKGAFWLCSFALIVLYSVPFLPILNGVFEALCIIVIFPAIVYLGASSNSEESLNKTVGRAPSGYYRVIKFLGGISYPLYAVHYPLMYLFYAWMIDSGQHSLDATWIFVLIVCASSLIIAWAAWRFYDTPVRKALYSLLRNRLKS